MENRKAYIDKLAAQLKKWDDELDKLEQKAGETGKDVRGKYMEQIDVLKKKRGDVQAKLNELRKSSDEAWATLKVGLEKSWTELKNAFDTAWSKF